MNDINITRELGAYKKMYNYIFNEVTKVIEECHDSDVKEKLIKAQQYTEGIFTGESYGLSKMSVDEEVIVMLLRVLIKQEKERPITERDNGLIEECEDWILDLEENRITDFLVRFDNEMKDD